MTLLTPGTGFPARSKPTKVSELIGAETGTFMLQLEIVFQMIGYSMPFTVMVTALTGAVPVKVTRLFVAKMDEPPLIVKGAFPVAVLMVEIAKSARAWT